MPTPDPTYYLTLTYGGISIDFLKPSTLFSSKNAARYRPDTPKFTTTPEGAFVKTGVLHELKHLWEFTALVYDADRLVIRKMFDKWNAVGGFIRVDDMSDLFIEYGTRTRPLATGAPAVVVADGESIYYAAFNAVFTAEPKFNLMRGVWECSIMMMEGNKLVV